MSNTCVIVFENQIEYAEGMKPFRKHAEPGLLTLRPGGPVCERF
jgi:hypothetical protein